MIKEVIMSVELDVDAICGTGFSSFDSFEEKSESQSTHFDGSIFIPPFYPTQFSNKAALDFQTLESLKTDAIVIAKLQAKLDKLNLKDNNGLRSENTIILCGNHAEVSYDKDDDGNKTLDGSVSTSRETDNGTLSGEIHGGISQDKDGNTSTHFGGTIGFDF